MRSLLLTILLLLIAAVGPATCLGQLSFSGQTFGTTSWNVKVVDPPAGSTPEQLQALIEEQLADVNRRMSSYREDSEISRFNASRSVDWFAVSPATATVVARSIELYRETEGVFDITVGPLVNLWHFGPGKAETPSLPTDLQITAALAHLGSDKLEVRLDPSPAIRKSDPLLEIDVASIAEGYAVDRVVQALNSVGCGDFLVEVGGEVVVRGNRPDGSPWQIAIVRPVAGELSYDHVVSVRDRAVSTSGNYRTFFEIDGKRYSHAIDPTTGRPAQNDLVSATVLAADCATADALSTAVMVMGTERGHALCQRLGLPLLTIEQAPDGFREQRSGEMTLLDLRTASSSARAIWPTILAAFLIFGLAVAAMAIGAMFGGRRIQGSCGGLANQRDADGKIACGLCRNPAAECRERLQKQAADTASADQPS